MMMLAKSYVKDCKHIVRKHRGGDKHAHGGRKLVALEEEIDFDEAREQGSDWEQTQDVSAKDLIDSLRGKFEDVEKSADKEFAQAEENMKNAFEEEKPKWMRKGLFASDPEDEKTTYTFEKEADSDMEEPAAPAPAPKHGKHHKKHHKPCMVITILALALIASHL